MDDCSAGLAQGVNNKSLGGERALELLESGSSSCCFSLRGCTAGRYSMVQVIIRVC